MKKIIRKARVRELTGLSDSSIWRKETLGDFPLRVRLGACSVGWFENEILAWIETLPRGPAHNDQDNLTAARRRRAQGPKC